MFVSLKNKIKEETGNDVNKIDPVLSGTPQKNLIKGHSRQSSGSSLGNISLDGIHDDVPVSPTSCVKKFENSECKNPDSKALTAKEVKQIEKKEEEWKKKLQKKEEEWAKKLAKKEVEYKKLMEEKENEFKKQLENHQSKWNKSLEKVEKEKLTLQNEKLNILKKKNNLQESLEAAQEYKKKVCQYQEDLDQLEGFQTQEIAKVKHLLLAKEQEVADKENCIKENSDLIEVLKSEVSRLRQYEEQLSHAQDSIEEEMKVLHDSLVQKEHDASNLTNKCSNFISELEGCKQIISNLESEVATLTVELTSERSRISALTSSLEKDRTELDSTLLRNAEINQQVEMVKQEHARQNREMSDLHTRISSLEKLLEDKDKEINSEKLKSQELQQRLLDVDVLEKEKSIFSNNERELQANIAQLEEQLNDKNKTVRILQQRLGDMKKTLQRELRIPPQNLDSIEAEGAPVIAPSASKQLNHLRSRSDEDDVNFKYLKHVLIKFLTAREYEAQHLTRAVATLLRFSPEEERLLRDTLDWKMSWFGTRPRLGFGQTAKTIPPS